MPVRQYDFHKPISAGGLSSESETGNKWDDSLHVDETSRVEFLLMPLNVRMMKQMHKHFHAAIFTEKWSREKTCHVCFDLNGVCQKSKKAVSRGMTFTFSHFPTQILQTDPHSPLKALGGNCLSQHHLAQTEVKRSTKNNANFFLFSFLYFFMSPFADTHTEEFSTNKKWGRYISHPYCQRESP